MPRKSSRQHKPHKPRTIDKLLEDSRPMTPEEEQAQEASFVIGNSFDALRKPLTRRELRKMR